PAPYIDAATARALVQSAQAGQKAQLVELVERRLAELRQLLPDEEEGRAPAERDHRAAALAEERARLSELGAAMAAMRAGVTISFMAGQRVVGFLCVLDDRVPEAFASDELAAMLQVGEQAAITIENSRLYERMKERDRLAALGQMAAGLAHEIRNPLGSIKGAAQYLQPGQTAATSREGTREFLDIIIEEVNRLNKIVSQFLDYARPYRGEQRQLDVGEVLRKTLPLFAKEAEQHGKVEILTDLVDKLPPVRADAEQLLQVFLNLSLNALQAMP